MALTIYKKVPEALLITIWFNDFIFIVKEMMLIWVTSYKLDVESKAE